MSKAKRCNPHKYHRVDIGYAKVWACALPNCTHYMPKHMEPMVEGKGSLCWYCGEHFPLDEDALKMDKPFCFDCRTGNKSSEDEAPISEALEKYLKKLN